MIRLMIVKRCLAIDAKAYFNLRPSSNPSDDNYFMTPNYQNKANAMFSKCSLAAVCDNDNIKQFISSIQQKPSRREFVIFGRSNVGKSSLINSLFHRLEAAYTSKKPGKTQQLNFYRLNDMGKQIYVVDSPGYGFASNASKRDMDSWKHMIHEYLKGPYVHRVICLFDSEHGLKATDKMLLKMLDGMYKQYILVATKSDKKNIHEKDFKTCKQQNQMMNSYVHITSSRKNKGFDELRAHIAYLSEQQLTIVPGKS